ncbi:hypothetical protein SDC9_169498 [bioreactor metagenome]|uniref:Uncharacterized protein n=1 Tax=bioreactor metagenome TaxID=1076179 RepID=A0A645G633_9ZZZZ
MVKVLNKSDLSEVTELAKDSQSSNYSGVVVINNTIYVSDQGFGGEGDRIIKSNVLDIVKETDDNITDEEDDGTKESPVTGESGVAVLAVLAVLSCCVIIGKKKKIN